MATTNRRIGRMHTAAPGWMHEADQPRAHQTCQTMVSDDATVPEEARAKFQLGRGQCWGGFGQRSHRGCCCGGPFRRRTWRPGTAGGRWARAAAQRWQRRRPPAVPGCPSRAPPTGWPARRSRRDELPSGGALLKRSCVATTRVQGWSQPSGGNPQGLFGPGCNAGLKSGAGGGCHAGNVAL